MNGERIIALPESVVKRLMLESMTGWSVQDVMDVLQSEKIFYIIRREIESIIKRRVLSFHMNLEIVNSSIIITIDKINGDYAEGMIVIDIPSGVMTLRMLYPEPEGEIERQNDTLEGIVMPSGNVVFSIR